MPLEGSRVLVLEARLPSVLADLIDRHGGQAVSVPAVVEVEAPASEVAEPLTALCRGGVDMVVLQTGVGTDRLHRQAGAVGLTDAYLDALRRLPLVVRGPKPIAVLQRWGIRPTHAAPPPHTTTEICGVLDGLPLPGRRVFIQHYGEMNQTLRMFVIDRGAHPVDALPYRWGLPADPGPLRRAVEQLAREEFDAMLVTSRPQVANLFHIAEALGLAGALRDALNTRVAVAVIGPVARQALERRGVRAAVEPQLGKMAPLVRALDAYLKDRPGRITDARENDAAEV